MRWPKGLKHKPQPDHPLKALTTFKIGGRARYFAEPADTTELRLLLKAARKQGLKVRVLGGGSNLLINDRRVNALVIRLRAPYFKKIIFKGNKVKVSSGAAVAQFLSVTQGRGLGGMEFLAGIPGTIGGALAMNAGQSREGKGIGDFLDCAEVMDYNGNIKNLKAREIRFSYRSSGLAKYIILGASFRMIAKQPKEISRIIKDNLRKRWESQDLSAPSAGCIFRNPKSNAAGRLIEQAGLKGQRAGGAEVSSKHANFIINRRAATSADVLKLVRLVKRQVKNKFGVELVPEIKLWQR